MKTTCKIKNVLYIFLIQTFSAILLISGFQCSDNPSSSEPDPNALPTITPEEAGYSSQKLADAAQYGQQIGYAALMAAYDGKVFFSRGHVSRNYWSHSIRKPLLNSIFGIYVEDGTIDLNNTIADLGIDDIPPSLTDEEKQATVRNLLQSRSGIYHPAAAEAPEMKEIRPERGSHPPGTFFYYNNWDFNVLGTIFEQETGTGIFEEFQRLIAGPIGMQDFDPDNCFYQYETELSMHPAYPFRISARDMLRYGILYQKDGNWDGRQVIPQTWIEESTTEYSITDSTNGIGYGYLWVVIPKDSPIAQNAGNHKIFYHTGVGVHMLMVVPDLKLVLVMRMDTDGEWTNPGEATNELVVMILTATVD